MIVKCNKAYSVLRHFVLVHQFLIKTKSEGIDKRINYILKDNLNQMILQFSHQINLQNQASLFIMTNFH